MAKAKATAESRPKRLKSECGQYLAERTSEADWKYRIYDSASRFLGESTFWSNRYTRSRVRFETGFGEISATFSYPMYPTWFRRRWVVCFAIELLELARLIEDQGGEILTAWKANMSCWHNIGFRAARDAAARIDAELTRRGLEWNGPKGKKSWQWDIHCPAPEKRDARRAEILEAMSRAKK